jgi:ribonuclease P protein subunit RPR2
MVKAIAKDRMDRLAGLAMEEVRKGNIERARRYVYLARRIGMKANTPMPPGFRYCKRCLSPLLPGMNARVRLRNERVVIRCLDCNSIKRFPYVREKRGRNDGETGDQGA